VLRGIGACAGMARRKSQAAGAMARAENCVTRDNCAYRA
jgi:hypothetical protein